MKSLQRKISVLIPTYNSSATIKDTLCSVLSQTLKPSEILVMDDGSTDNTVDIVRSFASQVTLFQQQNQGVSASRNTLLEKANGNLIALLDHDDVWHPQYLESQFKMYSRYPNAAIYYTYYDKISETQKWSVERMYQLDDIKHSVLEPEVFLKRYNKSSGFILPSFCLFRKEVLTQIGNRPLPEDLNGSDDVYLWYRIALLGTFIETHMLLGGYRLVTTSLSSDRVLMYNERVKAVEKAYKVYQRDAPKNLQAIVKEFLEASYRRYAKYLMGDNNIPEARKFFKKSFILSRNVKSFLLFIMSFLPRLLQPNWPTKWRHES